MSTAVFMLYSILAIAIWMYYFWKSKFGIISDVEQLGNRFKPLETWQVMKSRPESFTTIFSFFRHFPHHSVVKSVYFLCNFYSIYHFRAIFFGGKFESNSSKTILISHYVFIGPLLDDWLKGGHSQISERAFLCNHFGVSMYLCISHKTARVMKSCPHWVTIPMKTIVNDTIILYLIWKMTYLRA